MSSTNVPNFKIVNCTEVEVDEKGKTIPKDLNQKNYYGDNSEMEEAIMGGNIVSVDMTGYTKYKGRNVTISIDEHGKIYGDVSKLSKAELEEIAKKYPEILKVTVKATEEESR